MIVDGATDVVYWTVDVGRFVLSDASNDRALLPRLLSSSVFRIHPISTRLLW